MATGPLESVAAGVAEALRRDPPAGVPVVSVLDDGYRAVPMPSLAVDAPIAEDMETGLRAYRDRGRRNAIRAPGGRVRRGKRATRNNGHGRT
jgi:hypothetical protein